MHTSPFWLIFGSLKPAVTLKIRSRSPKPNQLFIMSQCYIHANLVRIHKYSLPNIYTVKQLFSSETQFKQQVKSNINSYVKDSWLPLSAERKTLCFLNVETCQVGKVHPCWKSVENTVIVVRRAVVKVRLLTDAYYLQTDRAKFHNSSIQSGNGHVGSRTIVYSLVMGIWVAEQ